MKNIKKFIFIFMILLPTLSFADVKIPSSPELTATGSSITVTWSANTHTDDDGFDITQGYYIRWQENSGNEHSVKIAGIGADTLEYTIYSLNRNTSYTITLTAYSGTTESNKQEKSIITDNVEDVTVKTLITGNGEVSVSVEDAGSSVEQFAVVVVRDSDSVTIFNGLDFIENPKVAVDDSQVITGLTVDENYTATVTIYPEEKQLAAKSFAFEETYTYLEGVDDEIEEGCFIKTTHSNSTTVHYFFILVLVVFLLILSRKRLKVVISLIIVLLCCASTESFAEDDIIYKNIFGVKGGWFEATESELKDNYEEIKPFSFFYERIFTEYLSADIDLGYSKTKGLERTASSTVSGIETELEMYPASMSVNFNYEISPYIVGYFGAGGDWWLVEENSAGNDFKKEVSGWHAKTGVKIFSDELDTFKQVGFLIDISYSEIDKLGNNNVDLGGWKFNIGLMYCM